MRYFNVFSLISFYSLLWVIICVVSLGLIFGLISPIYDKWQNSPTYISIGKTNHPIWNIDFPGVTICTNNMININVLKWLLSGQKYVFKITLKMKYLTGKL